MVARLDDPVQKAATTATSNEAAIDSQIHALLAGADAKGTVYGFNDCLLAFRR